MQTENIPVERKPKKISYQISIIILALFFSCLVSFIFLFDVNGTKLLQTTLQLQFNGAVTTGTVSETKEIPNRNPAFRSSDYQLIVSFEVDGKTYSTIGNTYYSREHDWLGESVEVIYDPADPNIALFNNFNERWMFPLVSALPE
jgi:hypothetical protein